VAMLFCQLGQAHSLREICGGLATTLDKIRRLGLTKAPSRSTLAYANEHRPWQLYEQLYYQLLGRCHSQFGGKHKFRLKNKLVSFDASVIALCLSVFDWANYRRTKGAIKLHLLLDHAGYLPQFVNITEGRVHEIKILRKLSFDACTIVAIDRGLVDYELFGDWTRNGGYFVTPLKSNADYNVVKNHPVPRNRNIVKDQLIRLHGFYSKDNCPYLLGLVEVWLEEKQASLALLTNQLQFGATIRLLADRYL